MEDQLVEFMARFWLHEVADVRSGFLFIAPPTARVAVIILRRRIQAYARQMVSQSDTARLEAAVCGACHTQTADIQDAAASAATTSN
jgi:hypothetical protein